MSRRLRMTAEVGDWLTELGGSGPHVAAEVGAALVAVLDSADPSALASLGPPLTPCPADPRETADLAYQQMLADLQHLRRRVSDVATSRKRGELRLSAERARGASAARLGEIERELAAARQGEHVLTEQSQRLQQQIDSFRTAKESAKAMYTVAEAQVRIAEALQSAGDEPAADLDQLTAALEAAGERMERLAAQGTGIMSQIREQSRQGDAEHRSTPQPHPPERPREPPEPPELPLAAQPAPGLFELGVDPGGSDVRILLAMEPADTVTLLAVLEGAEAVSEHGAEAVRLASDLLTEIREDGWPADVDEVTLENSGAFLAWFVRATS